MCKYVFPWTTWRVLYLSLNQKLLQMQEYTHVVMELSTYHPYITPTFSGSPLWGEINMPIQPLPSRGPHGGEKSTRVDVVEMSKTTCKKGWEWVKLGENPKMPRLHCGRSIKTCCQTTMMPTVSQSMGF